MFNLNIIYGEGNTVIYKGEFERSFTQNPCVYNILFYNSENVNNMYIVILKPCLTIK